MFSGKQEFVLKRPSESHIWAILTRIATVAFIILVFAALYVFTSCADCSVYGFSAARVVLTCGMVFCAGRIAVVSVNAWTGSGVWSQILLPLVAFVQLALLALDKASSAFVLIAAGALELALIVSALLLVRKSVKGAQNFESAALQILRPLVPPKILEWVQLEIRLLSAALYGVSRFFRIPHKDGWSYWKNSAFPLIFLLLLFVGPVELIVVRYVLGIESIFLDSILAVFFIWSLVYVYGFWVSVKLAPHQLMADTLVLNRGALASAEFSIQLVRSLRIIQSKVIGEEEPKNRDALDLTVPGGQVVELTLREPVSVNRLFGDPDKLVDTVLVSVDDPQAFCQEIERRTAS